MAHKQLLVLSDCPFCGNQLVKEVYPNSWRHGYVGCILDGFRVRDVNGWNRRVDLVRHVTTPFKDPL